MDVVEISGSGTTADKKTPCAGLRPIPAGNRTRAQIEIAGGDRRGSIQTGKRQRLPIATDRGVGIADIELIKRITAVNRAGIRTGRG